MDHQEIAAHFHSGPLGVHHCLIANFHRSQSVSGGKAKCQCCVGAEPARHPEFVRHLRWLGSRVF